MPPDRRRNPLGRGLDVLLGPGGDPEGGGGGRDLPIDLIGPSPYQPRAQIDPVALEELTRSVRVHGIVQPIVVRPAPDGRYELVAGERRWRAARSAGLATIPAVVRDVADDTALALAIIENVQREDLGPIEEAQALARLIGEFSMTHQQVADVVGRSRSAVSNLVRLLDLEEDVRALVESGELDMGHARALLALPGGLQSEAARTVAARGLSVRQTEALVRRLLARAASEGGGEGTEVGTDPDVGRLERRIAELIGAEVSIRHGRRGAGRLVIRYHDLDELDGLLARLHPELGAED